MSIVISLSPEVEARLRDKAAQQGQDVSIVAAELLTCILDWELQDSEEAIAGIQRGLDDFETGRSRSFQEFVEEQRFVFSTSGMQHNRL
jgi:predicted transcriptional regulator